MKKPPKPAMTFLQQVELLRSRGMILDVETAKSYLSNVNYYHLSGYWFPYQDKKNDNQYQPETSFEQIVRIYEFDKKLQAMLFEYIGHIEIQVRTQVAYHLALNHGAFAHVEAANFYDFDNHKHFIDEYQREVNRQKDKSSFVKHNIYEYGELPIWVAVEIMSFGMLSKLYGNIKTPIVRKEIARYFGLSNWQRLKNWLEVLSYIRNACAHHQRLYNRTMPVIVSLHKSSFPCQRDSIFAALLVIKEMLSVSDPKRFAEFINSLKTCLATSSNRDVSSLGFPKEWRMILVGSPEST